MVTSSFPTLTLEMTAYLPAQIKAVDAPQIALAGRSNVGKSSLINALAGRKKLARISATPGKTRSINFYRVESADIYLVDLPGYGYARASKADRDKWAELVNAYLVDNPQLKAVAVLLDCRLPPQRLDMEMVAFVQAIKRPLLPVLTKADKCKQADCAARQREWAAILQTSELPLLFSAVTGRGRDLLWRALLSKTDTLGSPQVQTL